MKILLLDSGLGLIPFVDEIIKMNKKNTYYLYMDKEYFPYGNKSHLNLKNRLKYLFNKFKKLNIDEVYILCNTLSKIYLESKIKTTFKVKTILELNLKMLSNSSILVTPLLKSFYKNDDRFISSNLASYIEDYDTINIINEIKKLKNINNLILGCTHYPLVKTFFNFYLNIDVKSYERLFVSRIISNGELIFYVRDVEEKIISKYFYKINIKKYDLT